MKLFTDTGCKACAASYKSCVEYGFIHQNLISTLYILAKLCFLKFNLQ